MTILEGLKQAGDQRPRLVLLFGGGLIGASIRSCLVNRFGFQGYPVAYYWGMDPPLASLQVEALLGRTIEALARVEDGHLGGGVLVSVIWAAGVTGFGSTVEDIQAELRDFQTVVDFATRLGLLPSVDDLSFLLLSSAGALFEGQRGINAASIPAPMRPYGRLKLDEEALLLASPIPRKKIFRLSSVYGPIRGDGRKSLIWAMVSASLHGGICRISGSLNTLRDYVHADDVAEYICRQAAFESGAPETMSVVLASLKPSAIFEIKRQVELVLNRRVYLALDPTPSNSLDITYSPSSVPRTGWAPRSVSVGIREVHRSLLH